MAALPTLVVGFALGLVALDGAEEVVEATSPDVDELAAAALESDVRVPLGGAVVAELLTGEELVA